MKKKVKELWMLLSVQIVSLFLVPTFVGIFTVLVSSHIALRSSLLDWQELSTKWVHSTVVQRLHNYAFSNKILVESGMKTVSINMRVINSLYEQANLNKIKYNSGFQNVSCSMHLYDLGLCQSFKLKLQKQNPFYLDQWFHRDIKSYEELSLMDANLLNMDIYLKFYPKASLTSFKTSLIGVNLISNSYNTSLHVIAPSRTMNFNQSKRETCYGNYGLEPFDPRCRSWYLDAFNTQSIVVSQPFISQQSKYVVFTVTKRNNDHNGNFLSISNFSLDISNLESEIYEVYDDQAAKFNQESYTVMIHALNGTVYHHRYWKREKGETKTWQELEFPQDYPFDIEEANEFQQKLYNLLSLLNKTDFFNSTEEIRDKFSLNFIKNKTSYFAILYPIEIISQESSGKNTIIRTYPILAGRVQRDDTYKIFQENFNFEKSHLNLSMAGLCVVIIILLLLGLHTAAVMRQSIDIPIDLLNIFLRREDLNLIDISMNVEVNKIQKTLPTEENEKPFLKETFLKTNNEYEITQIQNCTETSEASMLFPQPPMQRKPKGRRDTWNTQILNKQEVQAYAKPRHSLYQTQFQLLNETSKPNIMQSSFQIHQPRVSLLGNRSSFSQNQNVTFSTNNPNISAFNNTQIPIPSSQFSCGVIKPSFMSAPSQQNNQTLAKQKQQSYSLKVLPQKGQRRLSEILEEDKITSNNLKLKEYRSVELLDIPCLFEEMTEIIKIFKILENIVRLAQANEISGKNDDSLLQYWRLQGMLRITGNSSALAVCQTNIGILFLKKNTISDALYSLEMAKEYSLFAHFRGQSIMQFQQSLLNGENYTQFQDLTSFQYRLRLLALTLVLLSLNKKGEEKVNCLLKAKKYSLLALQITEKGLKNLKCHLINRLLYLHILIEISDEESQENTLQFIYETHQMIKKIYDNSQTLLQNGVYFQIQSYLLLQESIAYIQMEQYSSAGDQLTQIIEGNPFCDGYVQVQTLTLLKQLFQNNNLSISMIEQEIDHFKVPEISFDVSFLLKNKYDLSLEDYQFQIQTIEYLKNQFLKEDDTFSFACYSFRVEIISPSVKAKNDKFFQSCLTQIDSLKQIFSPETQNEIDYSMTSSTALLTYLKKIFSKNFQEVKDDYRNRSTFIIVFSFDSSMAELTEQYLIKNLKPNSMTHIVEVDKSPHKEIQEDDPQSFLTNIYSNSFNSFSSSHNKHFTFQKFQDQNILLKYFQQQRQVPQNFSQLFLM